MRTFASCQSLRAARYELSDGVELSKILLTRPHEHIVHIELNNPRAKNAFGFEMAEELSMSLDSLDRDPTIRCVLLSSLGADFTSGVDVKSFIGTYQKLQETEDVSRRARLLEQTIHRFQAPFKRMHLFSKPIVCVLHGICYGLGVELAACSDIRYASSDIRLAPREVLIGIAADVGSLQEMPRQVSNQSLLRELLYTGRDSTAEEALSLGFVSRVLADKEAASKTALEVASLIASRSPVAVQGSKRNLRVSRDKSFEDGLDYNAVWNMAMLQSEDLAKSIEAIITKSSDVKFENF